MYPEGGDILGDFTFPHRLPEKVPSRGYLFEPSQRGHLFGTRPWKSNREHVMALILCMCKECITILYWKWTSLCFLKDVNKFQYLDIKKSENWKIFNKGFKDNEDNSSGTAACVGKFQLNHCIVLIWWEHDSLNISWPVIISWLAWQGCAGTGSSMRCTACTLSMGDKGCPNKG